MSLLNDPFPLIETYTTPNIRYMPYRQPTTGLINLKEYIKNKDVWYCMFTTSSSFKHYSLKDLMGPETYQKVINKQATVMLDLSFEPFLNCIDSIYLDVVKECKIPPSQVIFMSNMYDASEYNKITAAKYNSDPIKIFFFSALEFMLHQYTPYTDPNLLEVKQYDKKFLNLNRRWRSHRPLLTLLLYHYQLLDKGYVSFGPCEHHGNWNDIWDGLKVGAIGNNEMFLAIVQSEDIKNMPPLYLDTDELHTNRAELDMSVSKYYENSYFSVVSETTFYNRETHQNSRFITEKTFKAIIMKHPFILVTIPKSLEVLKELGYKTFSPLIDESYDQEMDDNKRMMMIVKEIDRLSKLNSNELERFITSAREICKYNYDVLKHKNQFVYIK